MTDKFTNFATSTIANVGGIGVADTELSVQGGHGALFPSLSSGESFYIVCVKTTGEREIMKCTAITDDTLTVLRAQEGTTALVFEENDKVEHRVTAATLDNFMQATDYNQSVFVSNPDGSPNVSGTVFTLYPAGTAVYARDSIGPTGSGADHTWIALNNIPNGVNWVEICCHVSVGGNGSGDGSQNYIKVSLTGADIASEDGNEAAFLSWRNVLAVDSNPKVSIVTKKIPVTGRVFYGKWEGAISGEYNFAIRLILTGYGFNS